MAVSGGGNEVTERALGHCLQGSSGAQKAQRHGTCCCCTGQRAGHSSGVRPALRRAQLGAVVRAVRSLGLGRLLPASGAGRRCSAAAGWCMLSTSRLPPNPRLGYHAWYYSWHLWIREPPDGGGAHVHGHGSGYHRLDQTGQSARHLFTLVRCYWVAACRQELLAPVPWPSGKQRLSPLAEGAVPRGPQAVLSTGSDQDLNLAVQAMRWGGGPRGTLRLGCLGAGGGAACTGP